MRSQGNSLIIHNDERVLWWHLKGSYNVRLFHVSFLKELIYYQLFKGMFFMNILRAKTFSTFGHSSQIFFGKKKTKKCWNQILFETQSFSPRLTVKYILAPLRKRNDKCEEKREREREQYNFVLYPTARKIYFVSNYLKLINFFPTMYFISN